MTAQILVIMRKDWQSGCSRPWQPRTCSRSCLGYCWRWMHIHIHRPNPLSSEIIVTKIALYWADGKTLPSFRMVCG